MKLTIKDLPLDKLIPYARNARTHSPAQVAQIAASIKEFGFNSPVLIDGENGIIAGHGRVLAAQKLELKTVPTISLAHLNENQKRAFILADNKLALNAGWDEEMLKTELDALKEVDFDLSLIGFDDSELSEIAAGAGTDGKTDPDDVPEPPKEAKSQGGKIYQCGKHRVMCGDSTKENNLFAGATPDLAFSDPPYGISVVGGCGPTKFGKVGGGGPTKFGKVGGCGIINSTTYAHVEGDCNTEAAKGFYLKCREIGIKNFILWGGNYFTDFLPPSRCWLVWDKQNTGNFADFEMAWTSYEKSCVMFRWLWNWLSRKGERKDELTKRVHPTQKPVGLTAEILGHFEGETVYDGFLGSGTTLIAAEKTGRICYGMEISPAYVDVIRKRWAEFVHGKDCDWEALTPEAK